jgi:hypothetical protein
MRAAVGRLLGVSPVPRGEVGAEAVMTEQRSVAEVAGDLVVQVRGFVITTPEQYRTVAEFLKGVKALRAEIADTFDAHIKRAYEAHRALCAEKRNAEANAVEAEGIAKSLLDAWDTEQQREAERRRVRDEGLAREVQTEIILDDAIAAEAAGDPERAAEILDAPRAPIAAAAPVLTPKVEGIAFRVTWGARVTDFAALVKAAALHPQYLALLKPDMTAINGLARSLRERLNVPGVEAVSSRGVSASKR